MTFYFFVDEIKVIRIISKKVTGEYRGVNERDAYKEYFEMPAGCIT
jgi:hypothetical protein